MAEIFKAADLYLVTWLTLVQIIDHFRAWAKPDEVEIQFVTHRTDKADQILVFLFCAILVTLPIYKPRIFASGPSASRNCPVRSRAARTKFAHQ